MLLLSSRLREELSTAILSEVLSEKLSNTLKIILEDGHRLDRINSQLTVDFMVRTVIPVTAITEPINLLSPHANRLFVDLSLVAVYPSFASNQSSDRLNFSDESFISAPDPLTRFFKITQVFSRHEPNHDSDASVIPICFGDQILMTNLMLNRVKEVAEANVLRSIVTLL